MNTKKWNEKVFKERYGSLIDGADTELKSGHLVVLFIPLTYFLRRLIFCICLVFWIEFLWGQVFFQFMISVLMIIFLQWFRPLESDFATNMETFNEICTLLVLYLLMCLSDFVPDPTVRSECGKVYIALIIFYVLVHFYILF